MLLPMLLFVSSAWATDYISDVMLVGGSKDEANSLVNSYKQQGWKLIDKDLNAGAGGDYIYLLYKTASSAGINRGYITGFYIKNTTWPIPDDLTIQNINFHLVTYKGSEHFRGQRGDLNSNTGDSSDPIHLYYTRDYFVDDKVITGISFNSTKEGALGADVSAQGYDLNAGAGGDYIYMHVTKAKGVPDLAGAGTVENPFRINEPDDWHIFAVDVKEGVHTDKIFALTTDLTVSEMVGTESHPFQGEFYGLNHELNLSISGSNIFSAPFQYVQGAVINGVKTSGQVQYTGLDNAHASGLVGICMGNEQTSIEDCVVGATIVAGRYAGGIVGHAGSGKVSLQNCTFNGKIASFQNFAGGLVGWCDDAQLSLSSCVFSGSFQPGDGGRSHPIACMLKGAHASCNSDDVFYVNIVTPTITASNILPGLTAEPVSPSLVKGVWDDPVTASDGTPFYAAHLDTPKQIPYRARFEPNSDGWITYNSESGSGLTNEDYYEGKYCYKFATSTHDQYLVSPELNCRAEQSYIFHMKGTKTQICRLQCGVSTTTSDPSAFEWSETQEFIAGAWSHINFTSVGKIKYVAIKCLAESSPLYIDKFTIEESGAYVPEKLATTDVSKDAAKIQWDGNSDSYTVRFRPQPYFLETFDNDIVGWSVHNEGGNSATNWRITFFNEGTLLNAHSGNRLAFGRSLDYAAQTAYKVDNWLITPKVPLGGILKYWLMDDGSKHEHYEIWVSTTEKRQSAFQKVAEPGHGTLQYQWEEKTVDLSQFNGQYGYIAFRLTDEGKDFLALDDIALYTNDWVTITTNQPNLVLTDLAPGTGYEYQVQGTKDEKTTKWSPVSTFTTAPLSQDEIDAVKSVKVTVAENDAWYDLNGRRLSKKPVQSGLYIHNGRKIHTK